jgi:hypothetical protein
MFLGLESLYFRRLSRRPHLCLLFTRTFMVQHHLDRGSVFRVFQASFRLGSIKPLNLFPLLEVSFRLRRSCLVICDRMASDIVDELHFSGLRELEHPFLKP